MCTLPLLVDLNGSSPAADIMESNNGGSPKGNSGNGEMACQRSNKNGKSDADPHIIKKRRRVRDWKRLYER